MEEDWEQIADSKTPVVVAPVVKPPQNLNKWEGEDEEEEVKESWEDEVEEDEKKDEEKTTPVKAKQKKPLQQRIAEKERLKLEEAERLQKEKEQESMSEEQKLAEKLRIQRIQEEADLKTALETFGVAPLSGLDAMNPTTKEEFIEFADALSKKISSFKQDPEYMNLLEDLTTKILVPLPSTNIRRVKTAIDNLYLEKQKLEKGDKPKKPKGGKVKARLRIEGENTGKFEDYSTAKYEDFDEYDDFM